MKRNSFKLTRRQLIFCLLSFLWMSFIFIMSSRTGTESTGDSTGIGMLVAKIVVPGFDKWERTSQLELALAIDGPVRKSAHALEYGMLAVLLFFAYLREMKRKNIFMSLKLSLATSVIYAVSDEVHQLFVPGRSCQVGDVIIDSFGAFLASLAIFICFVFYSRRKK